MQVASPGDVQDETVACESVWRGRKEKLLNSFIVGEDRHNTRSEG